MSDLLPLDHVEKVVIEVLTTVAGSYADIKHLKKSTRLAELQLDSLKLVEVVYELETKLNVEADESRLAQLSSVGDLIAVFYRGAL
jgi:acyl carrier protein